MYDEKRIFIVIWHVTENLVNFGTIIIEKYAWQSESV
jgi:hypothetical protein